MTTKVTSLNPIFTQDPQKVYNANIRKAKILKLASIINFFVITIFAVYLLSLLRVSSATIPMAHIAIGVTAPVIGILFSKLLALSKKCIETADFYKNVLKEIRSLETQNESDIKKYLEKIKCNPNDIKKAIPAIAHFKAWQIKKEKSLNEIEKLKKNNTTNSNLKYILEEQKHEIQENEVLRSKLKLAEIHHIIENPTSKKKIEDFGIRISLSFAKRYASILSKDDEYFIFKGKIQKEKHRKCLTSQEIDNLEISDISRLIFKD
ncbi:MAG: hypothetical protein KR126chlam5_00810 [Candidatus Anoxychlamydiales bacterium]|nr:hypothetical protein [Candidatus Anoxychlamydiales bacterium]